VKSQHAVARPSSVGLVLAAPVLMLWGSGAPGAKPDVSLAAAPSPPPAVCDEVPTLFRGVVVIDPARSDPAGGQSVLIRDGRIEAVGPNGSIPTPHGARIVEGNGRTLAPGLADAHVHLELEAEGWLALFLANGVTTVFNQRGTPEHLVLRDRVARCELDGPTIYTSGPFTNAPEIGSPESAREAVRSQKQAGYDFLKIHGDVPAEAYSAMIEEGRRIGLPITGHAPRNLTFEAVVDHEQSMVAHAEELIYTHFRDLDTTRIAALAARMARADTHLIPTLSTFRNIVRQWGDTTGLEAGLGAPESLYLLPRMARYWRERNPYLGRNPGGVGRIEAMYRFQRPLVRALWEAGVPLLAGTDTPLPVMYPGFSLHDEIDELVEAGLTPRAALGAATTEPGRFIQEHVDPGERFGRIAVGHRADLVLVEGDPRSDPSALRHPVAVMARGRWYDREALDVLMARVEAGGR